ncbi:nucleocapsid protein [Glossina pallidipes salivary gland hypertrophy virus]|uniref:Nucleocapsid protein n=2 Tax=Glossina hytrovirus (isolate Glossina pallidipes/Ethiopia/Seibersdorf/-) TaxID=379529 RepID=A0A120HYB6_GHVS|nr:hypothetical protein SGHV052 [Glossina pallidipes salivary gland hypertrophy virus]ABQ08825.1 hypothetical protein SGHV052 [Glossina pallidipes salivary gland hypertrophy virus]AMB48657.1 nucleocapsid protein [Glossina pallidipes salivary gland hypertrophy virus]
MNVLLKNSFLSNIILWYLWKFTIGDQFLYIFISILSLIKIYNCNTISYKDEITLNLFDIICSIILDNPLDKFIFYLFSISANALYSYKINLFKFLLIYYFIQTQFVIINLLTGAYIVYELLIILYMKFSQCLNRDDRSLIFIFLYLFHATMYLCIYKDIPYYNVDLQGLYIQNNQLIRNIMERSRRSTRAEYILSLISKIIEMVFEWKGEEFIQVVYHEKMAMKNVKTNIKKNRKSHDLINKYVQHIFIPKLLNNEEFVDYLNNINDISHITSDIIVSYLSPAKKYQIKHNNSSKNIYDINNLLED